MRNARLDTLIWVLIYGGLLLVCLGIFVLRQGGAFGWAMLIAGGVAAAVGAVLIVVRSRRGPDR